MFYTKLIFKVVRNWRLLLFLLITIPCRGQVTIGHARQLVSEGNVNGALNEFAELYDRSPDSVYHDYLALLNVNRQYKDAEKLVQRQMTLRDNILLNIDLGSVLYQEGKYDKAYAQFNGVLGRLNGDVQFSERIAEAFVAAGLEDEAIAVYERTGSMLGMPYYYAWPLSRLYARCGNMERALALLLLNPPGMTPNTENIKALLMEFMGDDADRTRMVQKAIIARLNEQPENPYYNELLTWLFTHKNDWDQALIQVEALDERNNEMGRGLMQLAQMARNARQFETAAKTYDDILAKGKETPYYINARTEKLATRLEMLENNPEFSREDALLLEKDYDSLFANYPKMYCMQPARDAATLEALFAGNVPRAIEILNKGIQDPDTRRQIAGFMKLQLGDYYILNGQLWDASLCYSQVDKDFKQDAIGEDARFRNAKLAYYRGDFEWAQHQLDILKAATSELIANDALNLSVQITENVEDSDQAPLRRFAAADLLLFQNKDKEAEALLDSIHAAYPKHPLNDDILMERAKIAVKHREYEKAIGFLKTIKEQYGDDVLGDDAVFMIAEIYRKNLHQPEQARHYYEQLILDYQGSTFVQEARNRLRELGCASAAP